MAAAGTMVATAAAVAAAAVVAAVMGSMTMSKVLLLATAGKPGFVLGLLNKSKDS